ncbi:hypothetical protein [Mycolicibacterium sp.]|jgi:hypothetical protein|uniref:hypothetical protein n=1 Tax=Mycolicibacterium sp. TaxID=2320850 RepID=UPI0028A98936|nr:hypothetical protein [Mycolicibacterium sp.]
MPIRRRRADGWIATGLAIGACAGLAGLIAIRTAEDQRASPAQQKRAELDSYAAQLTEESARLQAYRRELRRVAAELASGRDADRDLVTRIAEETRPPGSTDTPNRLDRDTSTYSS